MATNVSGSPIEIEFGIQGNTKFSSSAGTGNIVLYQSNNSSSGRKCVAISKGIGILRSGDYNGPIPPASVTATCTQKAFQF
jgi:hypothetical protein